MQPFLGDYAAMTLKRPSPLLHLFFALAFCFISGASAAQPSKSPKDSRPLPKLLQEIIAEVGDASCKSTTQCHTIGIGQKACGGPERYIAWSSARSAHATINRLAEAYSAQRASENAAAGFASICSIATDPGASCNAGYCTLDGKNTNGPSSR